MYPIVSGGCFLFWYILFVSTLWWLNGVWIVVSVTVEDGSEIFYQVDRSAFTAGMNGGANPRNVPDIINSSSGTLREYPQCNILNLNSQDVFLCKWGCACPPCQVLVYVGFGFLAQVLTLIGFWVDSPRSISQAELNCWLGEHITCATFKICWNRLQLILYHLKITPS